MKKKIAFGLLGVLGVSVFGGLAGLSAYKNRPLSDDQLQAIDLQKSFNSCMVSTLADPDWQKHYSDFMANDEDMGPNSYEYYRFYRNSPLVLQVTSEAFGEEIQTFLEEREALEISESATAMDKLAMFKKEADLKQRVSARVEDELGFPPPTYVAGFNIFNPTEICAADYEKALVAEDKNHSEVRTSLSEAWDRVGTDRLFEMLTPESPEGVDLDELRTNYHYIMEDFPSGKSLYLDLSPEIRGPLYN